MERPTSFWETVGETVVDGISAERRRVEGEIFIAEQEVDKSRTREPQKRTVSKKMFGFTGSVEETVSQTEDVLEKETTRDAKVQSLERINRFTQSQLDFSAKLSGMGLQPITVVPVKLWNVLCQKFDLYRFENLSDEGKTSIQELKTEGATMFTIVTAANVLAGVLFGASMFSSIFFVIIAMSSSTVGLYTVSDENKIKTGRLAWVGLMWFGTMVASAAVALEAKPTFNLWALL